MKPQQKPSTLEGGCICPKAHHVSEAEPLLSAVTRTSRVLKGKACGRLVIEERSIPNSVEGTHSLNTQKQMFFYNHTESVCVCHCAAVCVETCSSNKPGSYSSNHHPGRQHLSCVLLFSHRFKIKKSMPVLHPIHLSGVNLYPLLTLDILFNFCV